MYVGGRAGSAGQARSSVLQMSGPARSTQDGHCSSDTLGIDEVLSFQEMRGWSYVRGGLDQGFTKGVHCRGPVIPQRKEEHLVLSQAAVSLTGLWGERSAQFRAVSGIPRPTDLSRSDRDGVEVLGLKAEGPEACLSSCH